MNQTLSVILSVERRISLPGAGDSSLDAQDDKWMRSSATTLWQTLARLLNEYVGIDTTFQLRIQCKACVGCLSLPIKQQTPSLSRCVGKEEWRENLPAYLIEAWSYSIMLFPLT
jgi:hypothetical protein